MYCRGMNELYTCSKFKPDHELENSAYVTNNFNVQNCRRRMFSSVIGKNCTKAVAEIALAENNMTFICSVYSVQNCNLYRLGALVAFDIDRPMHLLNKVKLCPPLNRYGYTI